MKLPTLMTRLWANISKDWYNYAIPFLLLLLGIATRFHLFAFPGELVFDEVHLGKYITNYHLGEYFFDVHPPLGKMILAFFSVLVGMEPNIDFSLIGMEVPASFISIRILPALAGALLPVIVYYISRNLKIGVLASLLSGVLVALENSLIVQSRFVLTDSLLLLFGFLSIWAYLFYSKERKKKAFLYAAIVLGTMAGSVKWTGFSFILIIFLFEFYSSLFEVAGDYKKRAMETAKTVISFGIIFIMVYGSIFFIHLSFLPNSGPGDGFMTPSFQKTLDRNPNKYDEEIASKSMIGKIVELNYEIYHMNTTFDYAHEYSSAWYTWPILKRPIYYWQGDEPKSAIYLIGNPFIYWLGALSVILAFTIFMSHFFIGKLRKGIIPYKKSLIFVLLAFAVNFLPFAYIGRVMFLYHYQAALVFSIIILAFLADFLKGKARNILMGFILILAITGFIYWYPLTYGTKLTDDEMNARMLFPTWR